MNDRDTIVKLIKRMKLAMMGSIVFFIMDLIIFVYSLFTTVTTSESFGFGNSIKSTVPLLFSNQTIYLRTFIILLYVSGGFFIYTRYCFGKAVRIYLRKTTVRDISINEFKNAKKAIFQGMKTGFPDDI